MFAQGQLLSHWKKGTEVQRSGSDDQNVEQEDRVMTIDRLMNYSHIQADIAAIRVQLQDLERPISSPNGKTDGGHGSTPGNPTERAAFRRMELEDDLQEYLDLLEKEAKEINDWLRTLGNLEVEAIIRWHFLNGKTWAETSGIMYKNLSKDHCRKVFYRFRDDNMDLFGPI